MKKIPPFNFLVILLIFLLGVFILSIFIGSSSISPLKIMKILQAKFLAGQTSWETAVIWNIRLPRIFLGFIVGAGLGCVGAVFQGLLGSLSQTEGKLLVLVSIIILLGIALLQLFSWQLNLISLSEDKAAHLGVDTERTKKAVFTIASIIIGAVVSVSGLIGFVGLIIPHIIRLFIGPDHRYLLIGSALGGGIFLIFSDTIARTIFSPVELPVGIVTAIFGAPFFLYLLRKGR
ncbi:MAG: iron ABC transporter permease [Elusimicrobiota bacterium]